MASTTKTCSRRILPKLMADILKPTSEFESGRESLLRGHEFFSRDFREIAEGSCFYLLVSYKRSTVLLFGAWC